MKESLFDIFQRVRDCYDYRKDPTIEQQRESAEARQKMAERMRQQKQAASEYASSLIPLGNDWVEAVKSDVKGLTEIVPPSLHFNKAERKVYKFGVEAFLLNVAAALRSHGKGEFLEDLDPLTAYKLGIQRRGTKIKTGLSEEQAEQAYQEMKQHYAFSFLFPDMFSMFPATYTVFGHTPKDKKQTKAQKHKKAEREPTDNQTGSSKPSKGTDKQPGNEILPRFEDPKLERISNELPKVFQTKRFVTAISKAEEKEWLLVGKQRLYWQGTAYIGGEKEQLKYFIGRIFNYSISTYKRPNQMPITELEDLFGQKLPNIKSAFKSQAPWHVIIDELTKELPE